jgi:hypothetical protein
LQTDYNKKKNNHDTTHFLPPDAFEPFAPTERFSDGGNHFCTRVETFFTLTEKFFTLTEKFFTLTEKFFTLTEKFFTLTEKFSTLTEKFFTPTEKFFTLTEKFFTLTEKFFTLTEKFFTPTEKFFTLTEKFFTLTEKFFTAVEMFLDALENVSDASKIFFFHIFFCWEGVDIEVAGIGRKWLVKKGFCVVKGKAMEFFPKHVFERDEMVSGNGRQEEVGNVRGKLLFECGFEFGVEEVGLGDGQDALFIEQLGVVLRQFVEEGLVLPGDVGRVGREKEEEERVALDVPEEAEAEAFSLTGALDDAGNVGQDKGVLTADVDNAEVGLEGGEGIVGYLGFGGGEGGEEGRFAGVGKSDESDVGQ